MICSNMFDRVCSEMLVVALDLGVFQVAPISTPGQAETAWTGMHADGATKLAKRKAILKDICSLFQKNISFFRHNSSMVYS